MKKSYENFIFNFQSKPIISPWAYFRVGLFSGVFLSIEFLGLFLGGLIFGWAYYREITVYRRSFIPYLMPMRKILKIGLTGSKIFPIVERSLKFIKKNIDDSSSSICFNLGSTSMVSTYL